MIDSGAEGVFLDEEFVRENSIPCRDLPNPIKVTNVDGSENISGYIIKTAVVVLKAANGKHTELLRCFVTKLGGDSLILGLPWLRKHNPDIDWDGGETLWGMQVEENGW